MLGGTKFTKFLDGEKLFRHYARMGKGGSVRKLQEWALSQHMVNPETNFVSTMGVYQAMWKWVLDNQELARPICEEAYRDTALPFNDEIWAKMLIARARGYYRTSGFRKFLSKNPHLVPYINK